MNDAFWRSVDGYAASSGEQELVILLEDEGPHVLEVYNTDENNPSSSGYKLRFKQLATNRQYDLHTAQYAYDGLSRLIDADVYPGISLNAVADRAYDYAYDPAGNRTQKVVTLDGVQDSSLTYTYNALNQLTSDGTNSYTYDNNGSLTSDGVNTYTWDRANRLLGMGGHSYAYNGLGQRVSQTVDSIATQYLLDVQPGLATVLAATIGQDTTRYLHGPLGLQSQHQPDDSWAFPLMDGLGSVRGVVNEDLSHLESRQYTPYGEVYGTTGSEQTAFGFTNEYTDATGLLYLRARYYDPALGRFFRMDPSQLEQNSYSYTDNNPINYTDPSGLIKWYEADSTDHLIFALRNNFNATIDRDYGWLPGVLEYRALPDCYLASFWWLEGSWEQREIEIVYGALEDIAEVLGGIGRFRVAMGESTIVRENVHTSRAANTNTATKIITLYNGTFSSGNGFALFTISTEYAHLWDSNNVAGQPGNLSIGMWYRTTEAQCGPNICERVSIEAPPDIGTGYVLSSYDNKNTWVGIFEDWAESFAMYVYRDFHLPGAQETTSLMPIREQYISEKISELE